MTNSTFNWRGQPSILADDKEFNGVNRRKSEQATLLKKGEFIINGTDPRPPHNQVNAYGREVVSTAKAALGI